MIVLGIDTGLANTGLAIVEADPRSISVIDLLHFGSESSVKKKGIRAADDTFDRTRRLAAFIISVIDKHQPDLVCIESLSMPRNASASNKIGMAFGAVATLVEIRGLPVLGVSPTAIKDAVTGNKKASKDDVQDALDLRFGGAPRKILKAKKLAKGKHEHPFDALGAVVACERSEIFVALRRIGNGT